MTEELIIRHCSPTLAGLKTGNMFSYPDPCKESLINEIRKINISLKKKGVRIIPLEKKENKTLLYIYRPNKLQKDLEEETARKILEEHGYKDIRSSSCISKLIKKLKESKDFPHEVGLFLGYPPEDVNGFIKNKAGNSKCVGHWKVYGDKEEATKLFDKYKKCTSIYCQHWKEGETLENLCVAV